MDVKKLHSVFFIGIGGIGMSALATYLLANGVKVFGYDRQSSDLTRKLENQGAKIQYSTDISIIASFEKCEENLVVYTPAVKAENPLLKYASTYLNCIKRSELLAAVSSGMFTIAVAGTHGKTSTSALITHILKHSGKRICAFVGGIMRNYNSNVLSDTDPEFMILEADEFDRSFLRLNPDLAVITSVDPDHLDIYGTEKAFLDNFQLFVDRVGGRLIAHQDVVTKLDLPFDVISYSASEKQSTYAEGYNCFSLEGEEYKIEMPGTYNVSNTMAAIHIARAAGLSNNEISAALLTFKGVNRRFNIYKSDNGVFVDDYAHHPTEISAAIQAAKSFFKNKNVVAYFQPHLFSRTKDFMSGFAKALQEADQIFLLDIYPAREEPIQGVTSSALQKLIGEHCEVVTEEIFAQKLIENRRSDLVNLVMGAGSIGLFFQDFIAKEVLC
jgi:UDP-N-acetylmuramate--alanine ligase